MSETALGTPLGDSAFMSGAGEGLGEDALSCSLVVGGVCCSASVAFIGRRVTCESRSVTLAERGREILDLGNRTPPIGSL